MATPRTSEEIARNQLRSMILQGELPTDVFLSQRWLAERVGVAVSTLRTALRSLEKESIIENVPRWGVRIPGETEQGIIDRYYVREILEVAAVQRIVQRNNAGEAARLRLLAEQCEVMASQSPLDVNGFAQKHFDFHHAIAACSGSQLLAETLDRTFLRTMVLYNIRQGWKRDIDRLSHVVLVQDILSGDMGRAQAAVREHIARGLQRELNALRDQRAAQECALHGATSNALSRWNAARSGGRATAAGSSELLQGALERG